MSKQHEILIFENKVNLSKPKPPYLYYPSQRLHWIPFPLVFSLSGRPPVSETLDFAGSALSTKFKKPLVTSNHYTRKKRRDWEGKGMRGRTRDTQKQRGKEISDFSCFQSLNYNNVGPILLIHNGMIPFTKAPKSLMKRLLWKHSPCTVAAVGRQCHKIQTDQFRINLKHKIHFKSN